MFDQSGQENLKLNVGGSEVNINSHFAVFVMFLSIQVDLDLTSRVEIKMFPIVN